ncbi:MAG: chemotaxis protein CheB [Desulfobacter sp.]|uniref:chemotaxis protein CheB n=1 Tax=uncultured Desulfobacter sp. TaxID=240139 RepID=UPI0029C69623|nr:chemotaxis protein CheB [uncultured Desulfobacter sp.]MCW8801625.1 chemotaxis protein CheB [Desulfobacter sp.]
MAVSKHSYEAVVVGVSAGGLAALVEVLPKFDINMMLPVMIVQHQSNDSDDFLVRYFDQLCRQSVREVEDKMPVESGTIYFAPANYHLLVEPDRTLSLSTEARVNYSRPSIDVLFESAADTYMDRLVGIILTGANPDGTNGAARIKELGGLIIAQDPETAEAKAMPMSVIKHVQVDHILPLNRIGDFVNRLN